MIKVVTSDDQTIILIITWTLPNRKITDLPLTGELRDLKTLLLGFLQGQGWRTGARLAAGGAEGGGGEEQSLRNAPWCPLRLTFQVTGQVAKENLPRDSHCQWA